MFSFHFSYKVKYLDFYYGSLFAVILVYKEAYFESEHRFNRLLNNKLIQKILSLLSVSVLVYNYCYVDSKSGGARTGYWSLNFFLMMLNSDSACSLKKLLINNHFLKNFGTYSFNIYLFHPTIINTYKKYRFAHTGDGELFIVVVLSYFFGYVVFISMEKPLIRIANNICKKYIDRL
jgi:peptidoglycan/LPS O-acetylase OafA/YrhL